MINEIIVKRFVMDFNRLSYSRGKNIKATYIIKDGEPIIVFKKAHRNVGLKYDRINHLPISDVLGWTSGHFQAKDNFKHIEAVWKSFKEEREQ